MTLGVCLISAGNQENSGLEALLTRSGLTVWTPQSPAAGDGHIYEHALCLIIDMPQGAALRTLRLFRCYGVETPALLIVDEDRVVDPETLDCGPIMDVLARGTSYLRILRWVQSLCAARKTVDVTAEKTKCAA
jgi:hypothetical protein